MTNAPDKYVQFYLTDQTDSPIYKRPDIREVSSHIMFSVAPFYGRPKNADGYRSLFRDDHRLAEDSGGFQILMDKIAMQIRRDHSNGELVVDVDADPMDTVDVYRRIGVTPSDFPMQLDIPPKYNLGSEETRAVIEKSAEFYHIMTQFIPQTVGVIHGWTEEELQYSLELIEDPDRLASGSNVATSSRSKDVMSAGTNKVLEPGTICLVDHVKSTQPLAAPTNKTFEGGTQYVVGNLKRKTVAAPGSQGNTGSIVVDHLSKSKAVAAGSFAVSETEGSLPERMGKRGSGKVVAAGAMQQTGVSVVDHVKSKKKVVAVGAMQQNGQWVCASLNNTPQRKALAAASGAAEEIMTTIKKGIPKRHRAPRKVVEERLATVLNMLRDRDVFILGGASPHFQHIIFYGGATYTDTSSWRLKAYLGEILLPEIGARSIGYKATARRLDKPEKRLLKACLRDSTHPLSGMSLDDFLELGAMKAKDYHETVEDRHWPVKPFNLRALHNAWVLKGPEEQIANEYACDPDRYYRYLITKRFKGHPFLTKRLQRISRLLKREYVAEDHGIFLLEPNRDRVRGR